ncbi:hypothetical protein T08_5622 [Trichinella sp. T8]|nr:hypothetical protein T08_5622 [Trichinella sp. T8]
MASEFGGLPFSIHQEEFLPESNISSIMKQGTTYLIYICRKSCKHDLYVTQASVVKLYSEVYVAFNQNAGDTSLSFENV